MGDDFRRAGPVTLRDLSDDGNGGMGLYVFFASYPGIQLLQEIDKACWKNKPYDEGHRHDAHFIWADGFFASFGIVDHPDIGGGEGEVERIFFPLLEKVEVQLLLDLLLS